MLTGCGDRGLLLEGSLGDRGEVGVYRPEYCSECILKIRRERCEEDERRRPLPRTESTSLDSEDEWLSLEGERAMDFP